MTTETPFITDAFATAMRDHLHNPPTRDPAAWRFHSAFAVSHPHQRRPGARTLGGWRRKVMLPDAALDTLMGGEQTAEQVKATLTPETVIACGLLAAARVGRANLPDDIAARATFRGVA